MPTSTADEDWHGPLLAALERLPGASIELGVHPGSTDPQRAGERVSAVAFAEAARERGHTLVAWGEI
jgi:hypothetical protein